jgi:drug/metabolite transporter (DMT)-like permease
MNAEPRVAAPPASRRPALAVVAGAGCIAASATFVRLAGTTAGMAAFFRCAFAVPVLWGLVLIDRKRARRRPLPGPARWLARIAGVSLAIDLVLWSHAINAVGAGLATALGNLQVLFVALIAWTALGERPAAPLFVALPVMLLGVVLIGGLLGSGSYGSSPGLGVIFGIGTSICYAVFILVLRAAGLRTGSSAEVGAIAPLYEATLGAAAGAAALAVILGDVQLTPPWPALGWLALLAVSSQVVGWLLISRSLPALPATLTSTLLLIQPAGAVALGAIVFGEDPSGEQLIGVALLLTGVLVATAGRAGAAARGPHREPPSADELAALPEGGPVRCVAP